MGYPVSERLTQGELEDLPIIVRLVVQRHTKAEAQRTQGSQPRQANADTVTDFASGHIRATAAIGVEDVTGIKEQHCAQRALVLDEGRGENQLGTTGDLDVTTEG